MEGRLIWSASSKLVSFAINEQRQQEYILLEESGHSLKFVVFVLCGTLLHCTMWTNYLLLSPCFSVIKLRRKLCFTGKLYGGSFFSCPHTGPVFYFPELVPFFSWTLTRNIKKKEKLSFFSLSQKYEWITLRMYKVGKFLAYHPCKKGKERGKRFFKREFARVFLTNLQYHHHRQHSSSHCTRETVPCRGTKSKVQHLSFFLCRYIILHKFLCYS